MKTRIGAMVVALVLCALSLPRPAVAQLPDSLVAVSYQGQSRFRVNVDGGALMGGDFDADASGSGVPASGSGTRLMWYPRKAAFRAGAVNGTQWDAANIGNYSVAMGWAVRASGDSSVALGANATAAGSASFAVGANVTASGSASVAMGHTAHTNARSGSFVFGDRSTTDTIRAGYASSDNNTANWRVANGFRIYTSSNLSTGFVVLGAMNGSKSWSGCSEHTSAAISTSTCAYLTSGGTWTNSSDVNRKHLFAEFGGEDVLARLRAMPIRSWSYRAEPATVRHLGPTAQDFRAAFGLGIDSTSIATVDADGVALAGVKALEERTRVQAERIAELEARIARLEALLTSKAP